MRVTTLGCDSLQREDVKYQIADDAFLQEHGLERGAFTSALVCI